MSLDLDWQICDAKFTSARYVTIRRRGIFKEKSRATLPGHATVVGTAGYSTKKLYNKTNHAVRNKGNCGDTNGLIASVDGASKQHAKTHGSVKNGECEDVIRLRAGEVSSSC